MCHHLLFLSYHRHKDCGLTDWLIHINGVQACAKAQEQDLLKIVMWNFGQGYPKSNQS